MFSRWRAFVAPTLPLVGALWLATRVEYVAAHRSV